MNAFKINDSLTAICEWKKTRTAFKHEATLLRDGLEVNTVKICYQNRTWECYQFESVLRKLADSKELTAEERLEFNNKIDNQFREIDNQSGEIDNRETRRFGVIGALAKMGAIFAEDKAGENDWKARMIKAGLNLEMPEDWETLSEEEKGRRLDSVIESLTNK